MAKTNQAASETPETNADGAPLLDLNELSARLTAVEELYESPALRSRLTMHLQGLGDLERIAGRVRQGTAVRNEVLGLGKYLHSMPALREVLAGGEAALLRSLADELDPCIEVTDLIERALLQHGEEDEDGDDGRIIRSGFHAELDDLRNTKTNSQELLIEIQQAEAARTGIDNLKIGYNSVFGYYLEVTNKHKDRAPDTWIRKQTLSNCERYITEDLKKLETKILGAEERMQELEEQLYQALVLLITDYITPVQHNAALAARLDCLLSLAKVAGKNNYVRPLVDDSLAEYS